MALKAAGGIFLAVAMARLRKAGRIWNRPQSRGFAARVMIPDDGDLFAIDPAGLFGRVAPLEVELGSGRGEFIVERASLLPEINFLAVELAGAVVKMLSVRAGQSGLNNLRVARMDARTLVNLMLPDRSVSAYHIYFPDPWPKERHLKHRLFTPHLVASLKRTLCTGTPVYVATDVEDYAQQIFATLAAGGFRRAELPVPGERSTGFARKYLAAGKAVYSGSFFAHEAWSCRKLGRD